MMNRLIIGSLGATTINKTTFGIWAIALMTISRTTFCIANKYNETLSIMAKCCYATSLTLSNVILGLML